MVRTLTALLLLPGLLSMSGPVPRHRPGRDRAIVIENFAYAPATDTVRVGQAVTWTNRDILPHTVTGTSPRLASGSIAAGGSWRYVATRRGTFTYHCRFHPTMHGTLVVR